MSKILKVSDQTHELVMSLRGEGETVDDVLARQLQKETLSPVEGGVNVGMDSNGVLRPIEIGKPVSFVLPIRPAEKNTSEATPQRSYGKPLTPDPETYERAKAEVKQRKVAGGGRSAADTFTPTDEPEDGEKPCCKKDRPCEHWQWRGETMTYVNKLSNRVKEPTT